MTFNGLSPQAKEVMMQMFVFGPTWDGFVVSKVGRDELVQHGFAKRLNGWQQLTQDGLGMCIHQTTIDVVGEWKDNRWHKKATTMAG